MAETKTRTGLIVAVLCAAGLSCSLMQTLVIPMLPELPDLLDIPTEDASWLITATALATAVGTPSLSRLADMYGKRRIILASLVAMMLGSLLGVISQSLGVLIAARALQGISIALIPVGISIMRDELPKERLSTGVALMGSTIGIGAAVGLPLSGIIYANFGWHALFWTSALVAAILIIATLAFVPESPVHSGGRFDILGAILLSVILASLLLGITKGGHWGWTSPATGTCIALAALLFLAWLPWELRHADPLVDLRTSARATVLITNIATLIVGFVLYCNLITITTFLQAPSNTGYGFGMTVLAAGLVMAPGSLTMFAMAPIAGWLARIHGPKAAFIVGCCGLAVGYIMRMFAMNTVWEIVIGAMIVSGSTVFAITATPLLIMGAVPINETAAANGLNSVLRSIGMATASAVVAAVITTTTITVDGQVHPSREAFQHIYMAAAVAAVLAGIVASFISRRPTPALEPAAEPQDATVKA